MNPLLHVTEETYGSLRNLHGDPRNGLDWGTVFVTPPFLTAWWQSFGQADRLAILGVRDGDTVTGIAPLRIQGDRGLFIGSPDICDYLDCIVKPGAETDFYDALLDDLKARKLSTLELHSLRPESSVMRHLVPLAGERGLEVILEAEESSVELDYYQTWDEYLEALPKKQRHELRRKRRNLEKEGVVSFTTITEPAQVTARLPGFLDMFTESRPEKAAFLTAQMDGFFCCAVAALADTGVVRLSTLALDDQPVAMLLGFTHGDRINLYNSGFDPKYQGLSVGLLSKAYSIEETIGRGMRYDFLKGREIYKYRLGGREVPLHGLRINIS